MPQVSVLIPLMRPEKIAPLVDNIAQTTDDYEIIVIAAIGPCADAARDLQVTLIEDHGGTWPVRINVGYRASSAQYIFTGADDLLFHSGWFEAAKRSMDQFQNSSAVIATNDLFNANGTHFVIAKRYIEEFGVCGDGPGTLMCEEYAHTYVDDNVRAVAKYHDRWAVAKDAITEHLHTGNGKAPMDDVYKLGESTMQQGLEVLKSRSHLWAA